MFFLLFFFFFFIYLPRFIYALIFLANDRFGIYFFFCSFSVFGSYSLLLFADDDGFRFNLLFGFRPVAYNHGQFMYAQHTQFCASVKERDEGQNAIHTDRHTQNAWTRRRFEWCASVFIVNTIYKNAVCGAVQAYRRWPRIRTNDKRAVHAKLDRQTRAYTIENVNFFASLCGLRF